MRIFFPHRSSDISIQQAPRYCLVMKGVFGNSPASSFPSEQVGAAPNTRTPRSQLREAECFPRTKTGAPFWPIHGAGNRGAARNYCKMPPPSEKNGLLVTERGEQASPEIDRARRPALSRPCDPTAATGLLPRRPRLDSGGCRSWGAPNSGSRQDLAPTRASSKSTNAAVPELSRVTAVSKSPSVSPSGRARSLPSHPLLWSPCRLQIRPLPQP